MKKSKDLFDENDDIDVDDLRQRILWSPSFWRNRRCGRFDQGKSSIKSNIKELSKKTDESVLKIDADDALNKLENAADKNEGDGVTTYLQIWILTIRMLVVMVGC